MITTYTLVHLLLEAMQIREEKRWTCEEHKKSHYQDWAQLIKQAEEHKTVGSELLVIQELTRAMQMLDKRETGEFHISASNAMYILGHAKQLGEAYIHSVDVAEGRVEMLKHPPLDSQSAEAITQKFGTAEDYLKQRALGLQKAGCTLTHSQILQALARVEGFKSYQALCSALRKPGPSFCPHCGAAGTLKEIGYVFCEQGEYDGKGYEAEGNASHFQCTRCLGQFADWSNN